MSSFTANLYSLVEKVASGIFLRGASHGSSRLGSSPMQVLVVHIFQFSLGKRSEGLESQTSWRRYKRFRCSVFLTMTPHAPVRWLRGYVDDLAGRSVAAPSQVTERGVAGKQVISPSTSLTTEKMRG